MTKKRLFVLLLGCLAIASIVFFVFQNTDSKTQLVDNKPIKRATPLEKEFPFLEREALPIEIADSIATCPEKTLSISFNVTGALEKGDIGLKPGAHFKKGQLLWQINNAEAFSELCRLKMELKTQITTQLSRIKQQFPLEEIKWKQVEEAIQINQLLPQIPSFGSRQEQSFYEESELKIAYQKAQQLENEMPNYFYIAPFSGRVKSIAKQLGDTTKASTRIAVIESDKQMYTYVFQCN